MTVPLSTIGRAGAEESHSGGRSFNAYGAELQQLCAATARLNRAGPPRRGTCRCLSTAAVGGSEAASRQLRQGSLPLGLKADPDRCPYASGKNRWNQVGAVVPKQVSTLLTQASNRYVSIMARIGTLEKRVFSSIRSASFNAT